MAVRSYLAKATWGRFIWAHSLRGDYPDGGGDIAAGRSLRQLVTLHTQEAKRYKHSCAAGFLFFFFCPGFQSMDRCHPYLESLFPPVFT